MAIQAGTKDIVIRYQVLESDGVTPKNISSASAASLKFRKPDGTAIIKTLTLPDDFYTDGQDGILKYGPVLETDLDLAGTYKVQALITMTNFDGPCEVDVFTVNRNV